MNNVCIVLQEVLHLAPIFIRHRNLQGMLDEMWSSILGQEMLSGRAVTQAMYPTEI